MNSLRRILSILLFYTTVATASYPDLSQIGEIADAAETASTWADVADGISKVEGIVKAGMQGVGVITQGPGAILNTQREPWGAIDEYTYALRKDLLGLHELFNCIEYNIVGSCLSVRWTWLGPKFTHGFAVEHFVRDSHIEVIPNAPSIDPMEFVANSVFPSSNSLLEDITLVYPYTWKISRWLGTASLGIIGQGFNALIEAAPGQTTHNSNHQYLYRDVQVSGNMEKVIHTSIASAFLSWAGYCNLPTIPGNVYFNSRLDLFSWRWMATSEVLLTGLYQAHHLAWMDIGNNYGSTMPRFGYIKTPSKFKASVVGAIRGASIAAENRMMYSGIAGLHIFQPLPQYATGSFTGGSYRTPQDAYSFKLDMVYPYEQNRCTRYEGNVPGMFDPVEGQIDDMRGALFNNNNPNSSAIFKLYRPVRCCKKRGNKVYSLVFPSIGDIGTPR
jgi:hypothetical protein